MSFAKAKSTFTLQISPSLAPSIEWAAMMALANDYRETLRIEQQIRDNPEVERAWTQHQVEAELAASVEEEAIEA